MYISLNDSRTSGFKKWSNDHLPNNDDPGGATPIGITEPPRDDLIEQPPHRPWVVPGVGGSF